MILRSLLSAFALLASTAHVAAQVHTDCNPLNRTDCKPNPAFSMAYNFNFTTGSLPPAWETTVGPVTFDKDLGATFTIAKQGESPTIRSLYYIFFGRVELIMRAAPGRGIISSVMLLSDDLDEIDLEFLGINNTMALTNYFGKGSEDFTNGKEIIVPGGAVQDNFHNYTIDWTKDRLQWWYDGQLVRTLLPKDANNTQRYPQTPCRLSIGIWAGSDPRLPQGTRDWAGGATDFTQGPFSMHVKTTFLQDYSSGKEYTWGDKSGSWQSIKAVAGDSTANSTITAATTVSPSIAERWDALSSGAKTGVYVGAASFVALIGGCFLFYFLRQRKRGQMEAKLAEEREKKEQVELEQFRNAGIDPDSLTVQHAENTNPFATPAASISEKQQMSGMAVGGAAAGAAAPLLRDGQRSPRSPPATGQYFDSHPNDRMGSPGPKNGGYFDNHRTQSPGPSNGGYYDNPSKSPQQNLGAGMRSPSGPAPLVLPMGPPSPGQQSPVGYDNPGRSATAPPQRMYSPGPVNGPQRSHTNDSYRAPGNNGGYGGQQGGNDNYWR